MRLAEESQAGPPDGTGFAIACSWPFLVDFGCRGTGCKVWLVGCGDEAGGFGIDVMGVVMMGQSSLVGILAACFSGCREGFMLIWGSE